MTIRSAPGTRAETLPEVQATRPLRGSSACSLHTSSRSRSIAARTAGSTSMCAESVSDISVPVLVERGEPYLAQAVQNLVRAPPEVVVQPQVLRVEGVVGRGALRVRDVGGALALAHGPRGGGQSGYAPAATAAWIAAPSAGPCDEPM